MKNHPTVVIAQTDEFNWTTHRLELSGGQMMHMVHLTVHTFSPQVMKRMQALWNAKRHELPPIVFAQGLTDDCKFERFVSLFGFTPINDCICTDGINRRIFVNRFLDGSATATNKSKLDEPAVERTGTVSSRCV